MGILLQKNRFNLAEAADMGRRFLDVIFPDKCLKCGVYITRDRDIPLSSCYCPTCLENPLPLFEPPFCPVCGHPFDSKASDNHLCESCLKKKPAVDRVRAAFEYQGVIRDSIGQFKYQARLSLSHPFECHLFEAFETYFAHDQIDMMLPIPLHPSKARKRKFNQSYILVRHFPRLYQAKYGGPAPWPVDIKSLARVRATPTQTGLDTKAREKNLKQAFACAAPSLVKDKHILLIDDVFTTGATCNAAARILKKAGASSVSALVLARA